jgi:hypothetical protein
VHVTGVFAGAEAGQLSTVEVGRAVTTIVALPVLAVCTDRAAGT